MATGTLILNSEFTNWNNRINNIRSARGLGAIGTANPGVGTVATRDKMNELVNKIINTWNSSGAIQTRTHYSNYGIATVSQGALIKWMNFDAMLTNWEGCYCSTQGTQGTQSTQSTQSTYSTNGTNSTNSTNDCYTSSCDTNYTMGQ